MKQSRKSLILAIIALVVLEDAKFSVEGYAFLNNGTYIEDNWEEGSCLAVIAANDFYGNCCSFSYLDNNGTAGCRLTVAGQDNHCGWNNKQYMEDCAKAGGCLAGPYVTIFYDLPAGSAIPVETCPPTQYEWQTTTSTSAAPVATDAPTATPSHLNFYNITYTSTGEACPDGSITARVLDSHGKPVVGASLSILLVGPTNSTPYESGLMETDCQGYAKFNYTVSDADDAGQSLWCSISVLNPEWGPGSQYIPCGASVCSSLLPSSSSQQQTTVPPTYSLNEVDVTWQAIEACPDGGIVARVTDPSSSEPVIGMGLSFLIAGQSEQFSGAAVTDSNGYASFNFTVGAEESAAGAGETLWCSIAVANPDYVPLGDQQVPCSVDICAKDPSSSTTASSSGPLLRGSTNATVLP
jgi:hypothetical protein